MGSDISLSKAVRANLLSLQNTAEMMNKTQNRLATGNKVNSALDNPSSFFTASALNSRAADMSNLLDSMASGIKVIEAANNGITALTKNLESMQSTLRQARQDKSFQTQSFEVNENSVINFGGGRFDLDSVIKLADAEEKAGVNASLTSIGTTAYFGPVSTEASAKGVGARTVIDGLGGIPPNSTITVAGVEVDLGAYADADELAVTIQEALDDDSTTTNQYTVMVGAAGSPNAGKIIIETNDPARDAAEVTFGTGTTEAVKGSVTFSFNDLPNSITVGGQNIATGTDLASFISNLEAGAQAGGYVVTSEDDQITLTAVNYGDQAPTVTGVPEPAAATQATTTFDIDLATAGSFTVGGQTVNLVGLNTAGSPSTATYNISLTEAGITTITVDGTEINIPASTGDADADALAVQGLINGALTDYTATVSNTGEVVLTSNANDGSAPPPITDGTTGTTQTVAAATNVTVGTEPAAYASASYDITLAAAGVGNTTISINGGADITIPDATGFLTPADHAAAVEGLINADPAMAGFTAVVSDTGEVVITADAYGVAAPPVITAGAVTPATVTAVYDQVTGVAAGTAEDDASARGKIEAALTAANITGFDVTVTGGAVSITATTAGVADAVEVAGAAATNVDPQDGEAEITGAEITTTVPGVSTKTEEAAQDTFTVSYDGKQAEVTITGLKLGAGPLDEVKWQAATVASINAKLEGAGIKGVEARFDDAGKLSLVSKEAEAKTLVIGGKDANRLFGDDTFSIGSPAETGLNSTKPTDKFVEFINKKFGGQVRASNDNGKLRIENLSTQELNIGVDKNGNGAVDTVKVEGNTVRANLHKQFNELRDQLDKLSDDASFNGINLLRGDKLKITFNESGSSSIDIQAKDKDGNVRSINASNLNIDTLVAEDLDTDEKIDAFLATLSSALTELRSQASTFGSNLSSVENRQSFTKNMINTLETGAANLTLADTNEEAANLLALQTRQQLSSSALSMASQQDQAVLQLLR
jgi:flagellin-like hook-associated protein FlgL